MTTLRTRLARLEEKHLHTPHVFVHVIRDPDPEPGSSRQHTCATCKRTTTAHGALTRVVCVPCTQRRASITYQATL